MKKNLLEVYALLMCLITSIWALLSVGTILFSLIRIANPEMTLNEHQYQKFQSNARYVENCCYKEDDKEKMKNKSDEEITKERTEEYAIEISNERRDAKRDAIQQLVNLFLNLLVFFIHWVMAKKARTTEAHL